MTNSKAMRKWISDRGLKLKAVVAALKITPYALQKKIDNCSEFKASEIAVFVNELGMEAGVRDQIFFAQDVE